MRIAVVGCGALGSYYGAKLCHDGQDVHFLLRSDFEFVRRHGVRIESPEGDFVARPRPAVAPADIGIVDLVLIGLKTTANGEFQRLLPPLIGPRTAILTLQNGLGNEDALAKLFSVEQILGGLCFACLNRISPGCIHHLAHGRVVLGEYERWPEPRTHEIASLFRHAGVPCQVTDNLERAHWEKLVWNVPFNGLGVASAAGLEAFRSGGGPHSLPVEGNTSARHPLLTTDRLLADPDWTGLVRELMMEIIEVSNALGFALPESLAQEQISRTEKMGAYRPSTLVDFERGQPLEIESLFANPLEKARRSGVQTPRLEALVRVLKTLTPDSAPPAT